MELRVEDLAVMRGGRPVLEGLSFAVSAGQALILRGPNGSGKTTLLRTLAGLQPALAGDLRPGPDEMAYASHADGLKTNLTVTENLKFWADVFGAKDFSHVLEPFDLIQLQWRPAGSLSAGQKRRLGLARMALTGRPIWLMDEPTVSLDTGSVSRFARVVEEHLSAGGLALIATHIDLGLAGDVLDVTPYRATERSYPDPFGGTFGEAFEDGL